MKIITEVLDTPYPSLYRFVWTVEIETPLRVSITRIEGGFFVECMRLMIAHSVSEDESEIIETPEWQIVDERKLTSIEAALTYRQNFLELYRPPNDKDDYYETR